MKKDDCNTIIERQLRYMNPENIAKDFPSERERAAISAIFEWISLSTVVARRLKVRGHYATCGLKNLTYDTLILDTQILERAEKILLKKKPRKRSR